MISVRAFYFQTLIGYSAIGAPSLRSSSGDIKATLHTHYLLRVSYLEVYNEKINDLLCDRSGGGSGGTVRRRAGSSSSSQPWENMRILRFDAVKGRSYTVIQSYGHTGIQAYSQTGIQSNRHTVL